MFHSCVFDLPINDYYIRAMIEGPEVRPCSAPDTELHDWLCWAKENGSSFLKMTAETALIADLRHYNLLRPCIAKSAGQSAVSAP